MRVIVSTNPERKLKIGVVGLGTGTMAAWGRAGDTVRFYEINPEVIRFSSEYFTYTSKAASAVEIVLGDARLMIERELQMPLSERPAPLDFLALDAFSSDAVPLHLLTVQAFEAYWKRVRDDGIIAVHISNRYLDLYPLVRGLALESGRETALIEYGGDAMNQQNAWVLITNNQKYLKHRLVLQRSHEVNMSHSPLVFTDDYSNLYSILSK